jgi:diadenosine tetraphosphate (Ap4A) HIT family hydrolase
MTGESDRRPYLERLPIGARLPLGAVADDPLFPLDGEIRVKPLDDPILPEPRRRGEPGGEACGSCEDPGERLIWKSARWRIRASPDEPHGLPAVVVLEPVAHHDLDDLPDDLAAELGPMILRVSRAVGALPDAGRVHVNRWGDGTAHFHLWFLARPRGMWQMRGAMLAIWDDILPKVPEGEWRANLAAIAAAMAAEDGEALI